MILIIILLITVLLSHFSQFDSEIVLSFSLRGKSKFLTLNSDDEIVENKRDSYQLLDLSFSKKYYENKLKIILGFKNLLNVTDVGMSNNSHINKVKVCPFHMADLFLFLLTIVFYETYSVYSSNF